MPLTLEQQFDVAMRSLTFGDLELTSRLLTDPNTVTVDDQRTVAERLGVKKGLLSAFVNSATDPTIWIATMMSRAFPTGAWLRGAIPQRFIGAANEFSGWSLIGRPVNDFFRGTNMPKLVGLREHRQAEVMKVGAKIFERIGTRPTWNEEMPVVSLLMEGYQHPQATPELRRLAIDLRGHMDELWGFLNKTHRIRGGFGGTEISRATSEPFDPKHAPRYLRDFLPHMPLFGHESVVTIGGREAVARIAKGKLGQALRLKEEDPRTVWQTVAGTDALQSDFGRYQMFMNRVGAQVFNPHLFQRQRTGIALESVMGQELFVTDLNQVFQRYVHSVARTYANNAPLNDFERSLAAQVVVGRDGTKQVMYPTNEPIMAQLINQGLDTTGARYVRRQVKGTNKFEEFVVPNSDSGPVTSALRHLVRTVAGSQAEDEILFGNAFSSVRNKLMDHGARVLGKAEINDADRAIRSFEQTSSWRNKMNGLASYFYTTTLGLNPWSAMQNMMQPFLTTAPAIGMGSTIAGIREFTTRMPQYFREFRTQYKQPLGPPRGFQNRVHTAIERAFNNTFPELHAAGIAMDPRMFEITETAIQQGKFSKYDDYAKTMLAGFTQTELANRATTFYGAKHALRRDVYNGAHELPAMPNGAPLNPAQAEAYLNFEAANVATQLQFVPRPGSKSVLQAMLPAPLRQFSSFPVRHGSFLVESTVRGAMSNRQMEQTSIMREMASSPLGLLFGGEESQVLARQKLLSLGTGRNVGTLARAFLMGRLITNGARDALGVDLGNVLGITPAYSAGENFYPIPIPPAAGVVYGLASSAVNRDLKRMQPATLPLLGEVPIPKTLFPAGVQISRTVRAVNSFKPDAGGFVDEQQRLMYRGDTSDFILTMLGVPLDKGRRVRNIMDRVRSNGDEIKTMRRKYALAASGYDLKTMAKLRQEWKESFPDMSPLSVTHKDVLRYEQNARIPLVQRMLRTMGQQGRYLEQDIYEYDPEILAPQELQYGLAG